MLNPSFKGQHWHPGLIPGSPSAAAKEVVEQSSHQPE